jgi:hypothetical protein
MLKGHHISHLCDDRAVVIRRDEARARTDVKEVLFQKQSAVDGTNLLHRQRAADVTAKLKSFRSEKIIRWGARVKHEETEALVEYLASRFPALMVTRRRRCRCL